MTPNQVLEIFRLKDKCQPFRMGAFIARSYGVTPKTIRDIWQSKSWADTTRSDRSFHYSARPTYISVAERGILSKQPTVVSLAVEAESLGIFKDCDQQTSTAAMEPPDYLYAAGGCGQRWGEADVAYLLGASGSPTDPWRLG